MKKLNLIYLLIFLSCQKAVFNNITEGVGGVIIGITQKTNTTPAIFSFTGNPTSMNEGDTAKMSVKLTQKITTKKVVTIKSDNASLSINGLAETSLTFTPDNAATDQEITLSVLAGDKISPETVTISFSAPDLQTGSIQLTANFTFSRQIVLSGNSSVNEEATGSLLVSLNKKPQGTAAVTITSSDTSAVTIANPTLNFTPTNYNTPQTVNYTINDIYNTAKNYSLTATSDGESKSQTVQVQDNDFVYRDISAGEANNSGYDPSLAIDSAGNSMYVVTKDNSRSGKAGIFKCDLNGDNCNYFFKTSAQNTDSGASPNLIYDSVNSRIIFVTSDAASFKPIIYICDTAVNTCTQQLLAAAGNALFPKVLVNPANSNISIMSFQTATGGKQANLSVCDSTATTCNANLSLGLYAVVSIYGSRAVGYDSVNGKIVTVRTGENFTISPLTVFSSGVPVVQKFNFDGSGLQTLYASSSNSVGINPDLYVDNANSRMLILSSNNNQFGRVWLFNCSLSVTGCVETDISAGAVYNAFFPKLNYDSVRGKILAVAYNGTDANKPYLHHCDSNGANCKATDVSLTKSILSSSLFSTYDAAIDTANNRLILVFTDNATGKLAMVRFGLGGF